MYRIVYAMEWLYWGMMSSNHKYWKNKTGNPKETCEFKVLSKVSWFETEIGEAYKSLRTNVQLCGEDIKVVALTSCTPNEGKTSISFQLAQSMAEDGKKVLC